jgi:alpha-methylacyl-CoA racemase
MVGLGPGPFCGMLLADMGAEVLRVDRVETARTIDHSKPATMAMDRGKQAIAVDLKHQDGVETLLRLMEEADAFFEVFRPGVAEHLGIGPDVAMARNPRLIYGRLTGWGQDGPYAQAAGHDIDYIALAGALEPLGRAARSRHRRSTCSATSPVAACCSRSASRAPRSNARAPVVVR